METKYNELKAEAAAVIADPEELDVYLSLLELAEEEEQAAADDAWVGHQEAQRWYEARGEY